MRIQRRLAFHFAYQLIFYSLLFFAIFMLLIFWFAQNMTQKEVERNFPIGILDSLISEAPYDKNSIVLSDKWMKLLKERNMWIQVVDRKGHVVFGLNAGDSLPTDYSVAQLLEIQETRQFGDYFVQFQLDQVTKDPYLYLLGYKNTAQKQLNAWFKSYQEGGIVRQDRLPELEQRLKETNSYLQIVNLEGEIVQAVGQADPASMQLQPLDVISMQQSPGNYNTSIVVYRDPSTSMSWLLHTPITDRTIVNRPPILEQMVRIFVWLAVCVLLLSVGVSIWHGYRYGRPLILFAGWFERMEQGLYDEVLTPKDKRRVFRRNGKLRIRYRLYGEVIQAFYKMAERLAYTEKERNRLEKAKQEWMSGISHDLRTPLSTIQGYGYMLESAPEQWNEQELRLMGTMIREKGDFMLELITDFSLVSQLKQEVPAMDKQDVLLDELVRRSVIKYVNDPTMTGSEFIYEGEEISIPIKGSMVWLQRLIDNLLSNAVKHNPPGVTIVATAGMMNDEPYIRVSDNGRGMDEETQQNLFKRYYRGTNTEESSAGSGLGMSIAKMIADAHDADIEVISALGAGTSITIRFPAR